MGGAVPSLPQYAFMAWCSVRGAQRQGNQLHTHLCQELLHDAFRLTFCVQLCTTWSVTLKEEHTSRVFGDRVLRGIFGPKREEVEGSWRRLHNEELRNL
jgi:hypothetical protein